MKWDGKGSPPGAVEKVAPLPSTLLWLTDWFTNWLTVLCVVCYVCICTVLGALRSSLMAKGFPRLTRVQYQYQYLLGHHFSLVTDHKPLWPCSTNINPRLLAAYEYTLVFRKTEAHSNMDALSRLSLSTVPAQVPAPLELALLMEHLAPQWRWAISVIGLRKTLLRHPFFSTSNKAG